MFLVPGKDFRTSDLAVDFGTGHVVVWDCVRGVILQEPCMIALQTRRRHGAAPGDKAKVLATGSNAKAFLGRTPKGVQVVCPMQGGVVADLTMAEMLLRALVPSKTTRGLMKRRKIIIGIPPDATDVERKAFLSTAKELGAFRVYSLHAPLAAAIGAGLPVDEPRASMVVDLGSGCCEAAIISLGGIVLCRTLRNGGKDLDAAIQQQIKVTHHLHAGHEACEALRQGLGSLKPEDDTCGGAIKGRDSMKGLPRSQTLTGRELRPLLTAYARSVVALAREVLERCPPELAADLVERGITLCGGMALQSGLAAFMQNELRLPVTVDADPLTTVARGLGMAMAHKSVELLSE